MQGKEKRSTGQAANTIRVCRKKTRYRSESKTKQVTYQNNTGQVSKNNAGQRRKQYREEIPLLFYNKRETFTT